MAIFAILGSDAAEARGLTREAWPYAMLAEQNVIDGAAYRVCQILADAPKGRAFVRFAEGECAFVNRRDLLRRRAGAYYGPLLWCGVGR